YAALSDPELSARHVDRGRRGGGGIGDHRLDPQSLHGYAPGVGGVPGGVRRRVGLLHRHAARQGCGLTRRSLLIQLANEGRVADTDAAADPGRGVVLLHNSRRNKATAFTAAEREALGLVGLLPEGIDTEELQVQRALDQLQYKNTDLERYIYLQSLQDNAETL